MNKNNIKIPWNLKVFCLIKIGKTKIILNIMHKGIVINLLCILTLSDVGLNMELNPIKTVPFIMFAPTILPSAKSNVFLRIDVIVAINSGRAVPNAKTVIAINPSLIFKMLAIFMQELTSNLALNPIPTAPNKNKNKL